MQQDAPGPLGYSVEGLCKEMGGVGRSKVYEEIKAGRLRAVKLGGRTIITADAAREYLAKLRPVRPDVDPDPKDSVTAERRRARSGPDEPPRAA